MCALQRLILYAKKNYITKLDGIVDGIDVNEFMRYYIKRCYHRDLKFKELMKSFYETFEDADRSIYKIK